MNSRKGRPGSNEPLAGGRGPGAPGPRRLLPIHDLRSGGEPRKIRLVDLIDPTHPLVCLAQELDWPRLERNIVIAGEEDARHGRCSVRMLVGMRILQLIYGGSDEQVGQTYAENPYWQYFCGLETYHHAACCSAQVFARLRLMAGLPDDDLLWDAISETGWSTRSALRP